MSKKNYTFATQMRNVRTYIFSQACRLVCLLALLCGLMSCHRDSDGTRSLGCLCWQEAKAVIAMADSLDQVEHMIYSDTAALGRTIRSLDNPLGRLFMRSTLGKAYYYMGRNYSLSDQIVDAADCYIEADRLQIDDPICRGRINSNMGYICTQNNNDSLALIFYELASEDFKESGNEWRYAHSLLDRIEFNVKLHHYIVADSLLQVAKIYSLDSAYHARYYETRGLYHYEQQQYDSALVYFNQGLDYWQNEEDKCFSYLKIMQLYYFGKKDFQMLIPFANLIIEYSNNPNYLANAYYCLLLDAKEKNDVDMLSQYTHARTDALKLLRINTNQYAEATPKLMEYLQNPHPSRWVWITLSVVVAICILLAIGIWIYRKRSQMQEKDFLYQQSLLEFEKGLTEIMDKYHSPRKYWRNYANLKKDIAPWLRNWTAKLDTLPLSEQEKIFCTISLIYPNLSDIEIANYLCYAKGTIRIFKNRILKKLDIPSSEFTNFLHDLSNCK
jgi:tetratricopeptide (TPR) repeat protein